MKKAPSIDDFLSLKETFKCNTPPRDFCETQEIYKHLLETLNVDITLLKYEDMEDICHNLNPVKSWPYEISTSVFKMDGRYLGVTGVSECFIDSLSYSDMNVNFIFEELEEFSTITYIPKRN